MSSIEATVDEGRLHIAFDEFYQDSVNSYNNWFTKTIAWIFDLSVKVNIGNEEHQVNRNSWIKFLSKHGVSASNLSPAEFHHLDLIREFKVSENKGMMRNHLSASKTNELSQKLFQSLASRNEAEAAKYVRKGADLNKRAWIKETTGEVFFTENFANQLPAKHLAPERFSLLTPFLLALKTNQVGVARLMDHFKADKSLNGESCLFGRDLLDVNNNYKPEFGVKYYWETVYDADGRPEQVLKSRLGFDVISTKVKQFMDKYEERVGISFDPQNYSTVEWAANPGSLHQAWNETKHNWKQGVF